ncbi:TIGR00725 family protein [Halorussus ruber]|uniref:TIGR00725 family protein n=1 Tax=Halorussus ruber TaxID=1126238 RepID=UPI001091B768|nr:TIGR00725 family protein [Halorussus ruber]
MRVSVIGGGTVTDEQAQTAEAVGKLLAQRGHTVVCGGLGGVMEAACRGATDAGGRTIGILPGEERAAANPYVDTAIATGLGHARNPLVVMNGDAVIAVDGGVGTLSELGFAGVFERPIAGLGTHDAPGVEPVESPNEAVEFVESVVSEREVETNKEL